MNSAPEMIGNILIPGRREFCALPLYISLLTIFIGHYYFVLDSSMPFNRKNATGTKIFLGSALVTSICAILLIFRGIAWSSPSILNKHFDHLSFSSKLRAEDYTPAPSHVYDLFPSIDAAEGMDYHDWNAQTQRELYACIAMKNCGKNQRKIALLAAHWFEEAVVRNWRGGEGVW